MMVFTSDPFKLYNTNIRDETLFGHMIYGCCMLYSRYLSRKFMNFNQRNPFKSWVRIQES